jgi:hypothetical protein
VDKIYIERIIKDYFHMNYYLKNKKEKKKKKKKRDGWRILKQNGQIS